MPKKTKMPMPKYVPSPKNLFLEIMRKRVHRALERNHLFAIVTPAELETLIRLAEGLPFK